MCDSTFISTEWAKDETLFKLKYIICDKCLVYILDARRDILEVERNSLNKWINSLELKIDTEYEKMKNVNPMDSVKTIPNGFSCWKE